MRIRTWPLLLSIAATTIAVVSASTASGGDPAPARRVVSMNPSLTRMIVALGAADALVGIDEYSARRVPSVADRPLVGGLYSPSLEAIVALRPDLVVVVPSVQQAVFREQLEVLGVEVLTLGESPVNFERVLAALAELGKRLGRTREARERITAIRRTRAAVADATQEFERPRTVVVITREPLYVAGAGSFLDEMLAVAGAVNLGARFDEPWPRASLEWLVEVAPEVIIDSAPDSESAASYWSRWPSIPAVGSGRVVAVPAGEITLPGPDLDQSLLRLARALHGDAFPVEPEGAP